MTLLSRRGRLLKTACVAHFVGLIVVGFYGTLHSSGGFGNGAGAGTLAGSIISLPWFAVLIGVIWFFSDFYWRHAYILSLVGALIVVGSWWVMDGVDLLDAVMVSSFSSALAFLILIYREKKLDPD